MGYNGYMGYLFGIFPWKMWVNHKIIGSLNLGGFNSWHKKRNDLLPLRWCLDDDFPIEYGHLGLPCSMSGVVGRGSKGFILWAKLGPWVGWLGSGKMGQTMRCVLVDVRDREIAPNQGIYDDNLYTEAAPVWIFFQHDTEATSTCWLYLEGLFGYVHKSISQYFKKPMRK